MIKLLRIFLCYFFLCPLFLVGVSKDSSSPLTFELLSEYEAIAPGEEFELLISIKLSPDWHLYWKNPGDTGMAPQLEWNLPPGIEILSLHWPSPKKFQETELITFGFSEELHLLVKAKNTSSFLEELPIEVFLNAIVCSSEICQPFSSSSKISLKNAERTIPSLLYAPLFTHARSQIPKPLTALKTEKKGDFIHITFALEEDLSLLSSEIDFFPEESNVDIHFPFTLKETLPKTYELKLKALEKDPSELKGILKLNDLCFDLKSSLEKSDIALASEKVLLTPSSLKEASGMNLMWAIGFAFLGGLLLNVMPCVLPVVSLKMISFMNLTKGSRSKIFFHTLSFSLGILLSFWILAALIIFLKASGESAGWGFQLQEPLFVATLAYLFTAFALNLFGVFEWGLSFSSLAGQAAAKSSAKTEGLLSSFLSGIFATAVATPCTGPFMGSALGYALTQSNLEAFFVFTSLALGMSFPYFLFALLPQFIHFIPKRGPWMETFKQSMGFLMLATVLWLLWVFSAETSEAKMFLQMTALLLLSLGFWGFGKWASPIKPKKVLYFGYSFLLLCALGALSFSYKALKEEPKETLLVTEWESFSKERLEELKKEKTPFFIDFTAKWCLICQANHLILSQKEVEQKMNELGVVKIKADWTKRENAITNELLEFGRSGVPLYVFYNSSGKVTILPQVLTPELILNALKD